MSASVGLPIPTGYNGFAVRCFSLEEREGFYSPGVGSIDSLHETMEEAAIARHGRSRNSNRVFRVLRIVDGRRQWPEAADWEGYREALKEAEREKAGVA